MKSRNKRGQFVKNHKLFLGKKRPNISRDKHYNWKGGKIIQEGYIYVLKPNHPRAKSKKGYVAEHVLVMEKALGRFLKPKEVVHHIDENRLNNDEENLQLFENLYKHILYHAKKRSNSK